MDKLTMCRICLVDNVRMHAVVDDQLKEIYERLTDFPFETDDHRPLHICLFCYTKLKQCRKLLRKCLDAEKLFNQMAFVDYESDTPLFYPGKLEYFGGLTTTMLEHVSILDRWKEGFADEDEAASEDVDSSREDCAPPETVDIKEEGHRYKEQKIEVEFLNVGKQDLIEQEAHCLGVDWRAKKLETLVEGSFADEDAAASEDVDSSREDCAPPETVDVKEERRDFEVTHHHIEVELQNGDHQDHIKQEVHFKPDAKAPVAKKSKREKRRAYKKNTMTVQTNDRSESKVISKHHNTTKSTIELKKPTIVDNLQKYISVQPGEKPHSCNVCQRSFKIAYLLKNHILIHTGEKPYKCDICQRTFRLKKSLYGHIRTHTGEKPYKCKECQRSFRQVTHLKQHMLTHTGEKPYKCDLCQQSYASKETLDSHINKHMGENPFKCDICQRSFTGRRSLRYHIATHTFEKRFKCQICQRHFDQQHALDCHTRTHKCEQPYKCTVCERRFNSKYVLKHHMLTHTGEKSYKCEICQRYFAQQNCLDYHIRIHTGEKPYKCDVCQRNFRAKSVLRNHILTHTHEKHFACTTCQRTFNRKASLANHMLVHSENKTYQCEICAKCFKQSSTLNSHHRLHKKEKESLLLLK